MSASMARYGTGLPLWDKLVIVYALGRVVAHGFYTLLLSPFRGSTGAKTVSRHVTLAMERKLVEAMTTAQLQYITAPVESTYPAYAKQKGFEPRSETFRSGIKAYWVGDPKNEDVIIWFHGGGYTCPADPGHFQFASTIVDSARAAGKDVAVLFPAYGLAPYATWPTQLEQGVESLRYVLEELGRRPGNVMLAGDSAGASFPLKFPLSLSSKPYPDPSNVPQPPVLEYPVNEFCETAGANLVLAVHSHILHPHPSGIPPLRLSAPLKGAIFMAPWWSFATDWPCIAENESKDSVAPFIGDLWSANFLGGMKRDEYNEPIRAEVGWWEGGGRAEGGGGGGGGGEKGEGLKGIVEEIFIGCGGDEILVDSQRIMMGRLEKIHPHALSLVAAGEFHDQAVLSLLGEVGKGELADGIRAWVNARL